MYSIIFSSRKKDNPTYKLPELLNSFIDNTDQKEKTQTEILIKTDDDDHDISKDIDKYKDVLNIKKYTWPRFGGRDDLHLAQSILYKFRNSNSTHIQLMADDFVFTRPNFVSEILGIKNCIPYHIIMPERLTEWVPAAAPCFSVPLLEVMCGIFGGQPNSDGLAYDLIDTMNIKYNINIQLSIEDYYKRTVNDYSGEIFSDYNLNLLKYKHNDFTNSCAKNLFLNIKNDQANE